LLSREVPVIEISHMRKTGMTYLASIALGEEPVIETLCLEPLRPYYSINSQK
jgi:hypothetical protein